MRTRTLSSRVAALGCAAALLSTLAGAASADDGPRLPKGWVRGAERPQKPAPKPEREWGSMQSVHEASFRVRPSIPGRRVEIASLPVVDIDPPAAPAAPAEPPRELPAGSTGDIVVLKKGSSPRVSVQGFEAGMIQVGKALPAGVGRQSEGGAVGVCGPSAGAGGVRPLTYEVIRRVDPKGSLEFVWARGFLDAGTCRVAIVERRAARPEHIGGGVVFAFRTRCVGCAEGERDVLHVLTPQMDDRFDKVIPFEHRTLVLAPGKSAAFEGSSSFRHPGGGVWWAMPDWHGVVDRQCKEDSVWCGKSVRLEVSQGRGETTPTVFVGGDVQ